MMIPLELTFRNMAHSDAIETAVRERVAKLERLFPRMISCRVVVEEQGARQDRARGLAYHVRVDVRVPGCELVGDKTPPPQRFHEDVYVALRDAFDAVGRELEDFARRERGDVKAHEEHPRGKVTSIYPDRGYGFIEGPDEVAVYFHRNSVHNGKFESLAVGSDVTFVEEHGDKGPQARAVFLPKKR
ncbi:MAG: HPF/RaiA family ribosome-associated protein [Polyangiaceae bacterium]|nr:HPF/RaiA family ribosome-associated protein [Polyangiaceae bacterium]